MGSHQKNIVHISPLDAKVINKYAPHWVKIYVTMILKVTLQLSIIVVRPYFDRLSTIELIPQKCDSKKYIQTQLQFFFPFPTQEGEVGFPI